MSGQELCPLCGEGHVTDSVQMLEYEYKGQKRSCHRTIVSAMCVLRTLPVWLSTSPGPRAARPAAGGGAPLTPKEKPPAASASTSLKGAVLGGLPS